VHFLCFAFSPFLGAVF